MQNFKEKPIDQDVLFGTTTSFNCVSEGQPKPHIFWRVSLKKSNESFIINNHKRHGGNFEMLDNSTLVLRNVSDKNEGSYTCISESPGLIKTASAVLTVYGIKIFGY